MATLETPFTRQVGIDVPLICGAMYPCSNPELIAAVSAAGGIGIIQPMSMTFVHKRDLREGIRWIRSRTDRPVGFNAIIERSSRVYEDRMRRWIEVALEEGIRFFITALGDPRWVVQKVHAVGGVVYHDVTERKWAEKALAGGVDGLICVNRDAGGHAGIRSVEALWAELHDLCVPLVAAGGIGDPASFAHALDIGYAGVQLGTRFIATEECSAHTDYKQAILRARASDIVLSERISGVPVAIIRTEYVARVGTEASFLMKKALRHPTLKHYARMYYSVKSIFELRRASLEGVRYRDFFQAGKSVETIHSISPASEIVRAFAAACTQRVTRTARPSVQTFASSE